MINYDYLEWGTKVSPEEMKRKKDYKELAEMDFFNPDKDEVVYEESAEENNEYNVWFFESHLDKPWTGGEKEERKNEIKKQINDFAKTVDVCHEDWEWRGGCFLDAFLLEDVDDISKTEYDSVLLLAPDAKSGSPLAIVWEMVPEDKRYTLMNLQRSGRKIFAAFSDNFVYNDEGFICVEVFIKKCD